jgi:hypothetical protein
MTGRTRSAAAIAAFGAIAALATASSAIAAPVHNPTSLRSTTVT